jgi:DNA-directed RNA polymerase subunit RPC12/RpoP
MARKHYECFECDAVFKINHDLDENYYKVIHCPFCGTEMDGEDDRYEEEGYDEDLS